MRVLLFHTETHDILNSYVDIKHHSIMSRVEYGAIRVMVMLVRSVARGMDRGGGHDSPQLGKIQYSRYEFIKFSNASKHLSTFFEFAPAHGSGKMFYFGSCAPFLL